MIARVALAQYAASEDTRANVARASALAEDAARQGAQLVALQELFTSLYFPVFPTDDRYFDLAEPVGGPSVTAMRRLAEKLRVMLLVPFYEEYQVGRFFNSAALVDTRGEIVGIYRKHHIPRVHIEREGWKEIDEKYYFEPGTGGYPVFATPVGQIGILICHDRHFPEAARVLALKGAELAIVPSASRGIPGAVDVGEVWAAELRALAITNVMYVCGINRVGVENGERFPGLSLIAAPDGSIAACGGDGNQLVIADLDLSRVRALRAARGFLRDRRPDSYAELVR